MVKRMGVILQWNGTNWDMVDSKGGHGMFLTLDDDAGEWQFTVTEGEPLIQRRTSLRRANEVAKVGFVLPSGERVGIDLKVREDAPESGNLPERLRRAQRDYMKK